MRVGIVTAAIVALSLFGCSRRSDEAFGGGGSHDRGRYVGVGLYPAGQMWAQVAGAAASKDPGASKLSDDEHIIVVLDSNTGELRQCGNFSGYCVGMNPWAKPIAASQAAPVPLLKHADQLQREAEAAAKPR